MANPPGFDAALFSNRSHWEQPPPPIGHPMIISEAMALTIFKDSGTIPNHFYVARYMSEEEEARSNRKPNRAERRKKRFNRKA